MPQCLTKYFMKKFSSKGQIVTLLKTLPRTLLQACTSTLLSALARPWSQQWVKLLNKITMTMRPQCLCPNIKQKPWLVAMIVMLPACSQVYAERMNVADREKMLQTVCNVKEQEKLPKLELVDIATNNGINVSRIQNSPGNCYLVTGKKDHRRYLGIYDPRDLAELFYILQ